jgi:hypothetical protein
VTGQSYKVFPNSQTATLNNSRLFSKFTIMQESDLKQGAKLYYKPTEGNEVQDGQTYTVVSLKDGKVELLPTSGKRKGAARNVTAKYPVERVLAEFQLEKPWETTPKPNPMPEDSKKEKIRLDKPVVQPTATPEKEEK